MRMRAGAIEWLVAIVFVLPSCSAVGEDDTYYDLRAVVTTGQEGSDGDVTLCWTMTGKETCKELSSGRNDFEAGATDTFDVSLNPRVAHGTPFTGFVLKYTTGLSIGDTWEPTGLRLSLFYGGGKEELVCNPTFDQTLSNGATLAPPGCP